MPVIEFRCLGSLELRGADGRELHSLLAQPKRMALFAYLCIALPRGFHRRDTLLGLFWPNADQDHARGALRNALHILRRTLGDDAILNRGDEDVAVDFQRVSCDVVVFEEALRLGRMEEALELYRGDLLTGFFVDEAPEFEQWLHAERTRLRACAGRAAYAAAERHESNGDAVAAVSCARRSLELVDTDERVLRKLIELQCKAGDRAGAIQVYETFARHIAAEYETEPTSETRSLIERIRSGKEELGGKESAEPRPERARVSRPSAIVPHVAEAHVPMNPLDATRFLANRKVAGLAVTVVAGIALWFGLRQMHTASIHSNRVAVMPFSVTGASQIEGIGSGMVELLSAVLDGAGDLNTVDERAVLSTLKREAADSSDPISARRIARLLGAGAFVVGNVTFVGHSMLITATVYRADDNGFDPTIQVRESGSPDSLTVLIDRIARKIVAGVSPGAQADLTELAGLTTRSNDALKAYLRGRLQFREGRHRSAVADFEKAVAADSNFAIGWYALGRTASFTPERDLERRSLLRAHDLRAQLPTLDQLRIESQLLYASGRIQESERAFREILRRHPDDVDAQFGLAVLLTHAAHRMGRSPSEAEPLLTRVSYYEPKNLDVLNFGRLLAADSRNLKRYDSLSRRYLEISPNADFALPYQAEQAYLRKDTAAENQVLTQLTAADDFLLGFAVTSVGGYLQDLAGAIPIAERFIDTRRSVENQASGRLMLAQLELAQGHWRKASLQLDEAARLDPNSALESRALLSLHPLLRTPVDSLKALYQEVESWKPHATITGSRIDIGRGQQVFEPEFRLYLLGALAARLGNYPAALSAAGELDRREPGEIGREYARGAAASVRAQVALSQGQLDRAVELFERAPVHVWWNMYYWDPFFSQGFERYLRAESLAKLGRFDEAARWYRSNTGAMSIAETMYLVPSLIGLRNVDAKLGRNGEISAIDARLRELWRDPDAEVVASVVDHR